MNKVVHGSLDGFGPSWMFLLILLCCSHPLRGDENTLPLSPQQVAMGGTALGAEPTSEAGLLNPALLGLVAGSSLTSHFVRRFDLAELDQITLTAGHNLKILSIGAAYSNLGQSDLLLENRLALALARRLRGSTYVGLRWDYRYVSFGGRYGSLDQHALAVGVAARFSWGVVHGALTDLNGPRLSAQDRKTSLGYRAGISFASPGLIVNLETTGRRHQFERYRLGQELCFGTKYYLRLGLATNPTSPSAGWGVGVGRFRLDYAYFWQSHLGGSHAFGLVFAE